MGGREEWGEEVVGEQSVGRGHGRVSAYISR